MRIAPPVLALLLASPILAQQAPTPAPFQAAPSAATATVPAVLPEEQQLAVRERLAQMRAQTEAQINARLNACPVGFTVERRANAETALAKTPDGRLAQSLDFTFRGARAIVEADITVHGMTPRARMVERPLGEYDDDAEEFALKGTAAVPLTLSSVWLRQLGTVSWADLTRVVYSDGTVWTPQDKPHCTARPSMMVLVGSSTRLK